MERNKDNGDRQMGETFLIICGGVTLSSAEAFPRGCFVIGTDDNATSPNEPRWASAPLKKGMDVRMSMPLIWPGQVSQAARA
jgi:hypothetical protein